MATGYGYFPGCSLKGTGAAYEESLLELFRVLELKLEELGDWNCCGATSYMSIDERSAFLLSARNLALAHHLAEFLGQHRHGETGRVELVLNRLALEAIHDVGDVDLAGTVDRARVTGCA